MKTESTKSPEYVPADKPMLLIKKELTVTRAAHSDPISDHDLEILCEQISELVDDLVDAYEANLKEAVKAKFGEQYIVVIA